MMSCITTETSKFRQWANIHSLAEGFELAVSANCDSFCHIAPMSQYSEDFLKRNVQKIVSTSDPYSVVYPCKKKREKEDIILFVPKLLKNMVN